MSPQARKSWALFLAAMMLQTGCTPMQPFYLHEDGDLSHLLEMATEIETADVEHHSLAEVTEAHEPRTVIVPDFKEFWDLKLEDAVQITLHNSKVIRSFGQLRGSSQLSRTPLPVPERILQSPDATTTAFDVAIQESDPNTGLEAALAAFDAQFRIDAAPSVGRGFLWDAQDRPRNNDPNIVAADTLDQSRSRVVLELEKLTAAGTRFFIRSQTDYDRGNALGGAGMGVQRLNSFWIQALEVEARQPLLRGRGTQVNRVPTVLARIRTDITLANFEAGVRNVVSDVERAYWELFFFYHALETAKAARDSSLVTWRRIHALYTVGAVGGEAEKEAQSRQQYFEFRARVEEALRDLYKAENRLRFIMGLAATDGRLIRPGTEPTIARVTFDWHDISCEALARSVELRQQRWRIKQHEMELIAARNQLLPQLDFVGIYRWLGLGDELINAQRNGLDFPAVGSTAFDELAEGNFQEFTFGFRLDLPIGFRRELAGVRNVQLLMARAKARLEDMELELSHALTDSIQELHAQYALAQTNFNRRSAADTEVDSVQAAYELGTATLDLLLDAQRRRAQAEIDFYAAVASYNLAITQVHFRKGSLLEYNSILLAEGPWPGKAYFDAKGLARKRDASYYLDYGFTRPRVISRGPYQQHAGDKGEHQIVDPQTLNTDESDDGETVEPPLPEPDVQGPLPTDELDSDFDLDLSAGGGGPSDAPGHLLPRGATVSADRDRAEFQWGSLGLGQAGAAKRADYQEPVGKRGHGKGESAAGQLLANPPPAQADRLAPERQGAQR